MKAVSAITAAHVAKLAGVSVSTVSRVVNAHPSVTPETVANVRRAMRELAFEPRVRPRFTRQNGTSAERPRITFIMFGAGTASPAPSFQRLLYGVSRGADALDLSLTFSHVDDVRAVPAKLLDKVDGLLLHGLVPEAAVAATLARLPTVWLMGNRTRPGWGDQVMPDNTAIGTLAARYLLGRRHRRLAYLGLGGWSWSFGIRALAFAQACQDADAEQHELIAAPLGDAQYWGGDLPRAAGELVDQLLALPRRPTGVFISEDRLLPVVQATLLERGIRLRDPAAPAGIRDDDDGVDLISCNNDARHLPLRGPVPPSIDIGAETIGERGVEHLLWRIANTDREERLRTMIAPTLVETQGRS